MGMVEAYALFCRVTGALPNLLPLDMVSISGHKQVGDRVQNSLLLDGKEVQVDVRFVGDGYIDPAWMSRVIENRVRSRNGLFYVMDSTDYFYTLLYHATVQKKSFGADYFERLVQMPIV